MIGLDEQFVGQRLAACVKIAIAGHVTARLDEGGPVPGYRRFSSALPTRQEGDALAQGAADIPGTSEQVQIPTHDSMKTSLLLQGEMVLDFALIRFERIEKDIAGSSGFFGQRRDPGGAGALGDAGQVWRTNSSQRLLHVVEKLADATRFDCLDL